MAQWAKVLTIKPGHLSAIPQTYTVDEENQIPKVVLCPHTCPGNLPLCPSKETFLKKISES